MGLFDEIWFEGPLPGIQSNCRRFQTKSLHCCLDRYNVTEEGRLYLTRNVRLGDGSTDIALDKSKRIDIDFHGDIRLMSDEGPIEEYVVRFTHGTLEWVRPLSDVPEFNQPPD
jgi:hypothetical protein